METRVVEEFRELTVVQFDFVLPSGVKESAYLVEGKYTYERDVDHIHIRVEELDKDIWVPVVGTFIRKTVQTMKERVKQDGECQLCSVKALGSSGLCKEHGGKEDS